MSCMLKENEFARLFLNGTRLLMIDAIRDTLKVTDLNCLIQKELVRLLLKGLYLLKYDRKLIFDTG